MRIRQRCSGRVTAMGFTGANERGAFRALLKRCLSLVPFFALTACSWPAADGAGRVHLVLGIGLIETRTTTATSISSANVGAVAQQMTVSGAMIGFGPPLTGLLIGHWRRQCVEIDPSVDVMIEATTDDSGAFAVRTSSLITSNSKETSE